VKLIADPESYLHLLQAEDYSSRYVPKQLLHLTDQKAVLESALWNLFFEETLELFRGLHEDR
jgi:hypothetical protein